MLVRPHTNETFGRRVLYPVVKVMKEFSKYIAEKWNISETLSKELCESYEKGYSPYYVADYRPPVCAEIDVWPVWGVYDFLRVAAELAPKKKRLVNALKKAGKLTDQLEKRIMHLTDGFELDDMLINERLQPRSKGQLALKKGLGEPAEKILSQQSTDSLEECIAPYVGKEPSLKTEADVVAGIKDIIAERFAYDETARAVVREFMYDDGFFEVVSKVKNNEILSKYVGKLVGVKEVPKEELLLLMAAEDNKQIRLKFTVQLFRITELLKHHFLIDPDSPGFSLISEAIDDCWLRLLQPIAERDVKERLRAEAEEWALSVIQQDLKKKIDQEGEEHVVFVCGIPDKKQFALIACSDRGRLIGAAMEKKIAIDKPVLSERLRQFLMRHRPDRIIIADNESAGSAETIVRKTLDSLQQPLDIVKNTFDQAASEVARSEWMKKHFSDLEEPMQKMYALGVACLRPLRLLATAGVEHVTVHPLQAAVSPQRMKECLQRLVAAKALSGGITAADCVETLSGITLEPFVPDAIIKEIIARSSKTPFTSKDDLLKVPDITEGAYRNVAGYFMIPTAQSALDRTMVHPEHFSWVGAMCDELRLSPENLVADPEAVRSCHESDPVKRIFLEKKLIPQLKAGQRYGAIAFSKPRRKYKLTELTEGSVVSGRVTNITPFGVFVNINAVCDGLIHISQLADTYVESADQVVAVNDMVSVRILKVDAKKRRISLSMKGLGMPAPKVAPSKKQLTDLASHFQNR